MAAAVTWDFEPRTVAFSVCLRASFHQSLGGAVVSLPWLTATGALGAPVVLGPFGEGAADVTRGGRCGNRPGAKRIRLEKGLGSLQVTLELVQALRQATLPLTVELPGVSGPVQVPSSARVHLAPLLLAGGAPLGSSGAADGDDAASVGTQPAAWASQERAQTVSAVLTDTVGLAGLYSLEVVISTDIPILSRPMLRRFMPACFMLETLTGLPNEAWLSEKCDDVHLQVYPELSRVTAELADALPQKCTVRRPHGSAARFSEPVIWFLGLAPHHVMREWMSHEGIIVEIHDRDVRDASGTASVGKATDSGQEAKSKQDLITLLDRQGGHVKQAAHPHGVARFQFSQLLESQSLQVNMRAEVVPNRSDKKRRRAEAMKHGLHAEGLLDTEEGAGIVAQRSSLDKREDTANYHRGTVLTLRASLAVPFPDAKKIEDREHGKRQEHWAAAEQNLTGDGSIFVAAAAEPNPSSAAVPRALPFRAKVTLPNGTELHGPWRKHQADAEKDERELREADCADAGSAARELHEELHRQAHEGLDCRFERFGRAVLVVDETELDVIRAVLDHVITWNSGIKKLDPTSAEATTYQLTPEEQTDPHLDILTGFAVLDGMCRIIVLEGLREQGGLKALATIVGHGVRGNSTGFKLLYNPDMGFSQRLYADFAGLSLKQIKIRMPLEKLAKKPDNYSMNGLVATDTFEAMQAIKLLMEVKQMARLRNLRKGSFFPKLPHLTNLQILYGGFLSDAELEARAPSPMGSPKSTKGPSSPSGLNATRSMVELQAVTTLKPGKISSSETVSKDRAFRKAVTDHHNPGFEESRKLKASSSAPNFIATNRGLVQQQFEERAKLNESLGKHRHIETPFLKGQPVYAYSSQRLNCCEKQKAWMREQMDKEADKTMWTYGDVYLSQNFEFSGAAPPGIVPPRPLRKDDSYANVPGDSRPPWRATPARPKEEFRKPPLDVSAMRQEDLHEPFSENEWHRFAVGEERTKPIAVQVTYDPDKIPHQRRVGEKPFDRCRLQPGPRDFGPQDMWESVHYHGRAPGELVGEEVERHNIRERSQSAAKILAGTDMRAFSQSATRKCITDSDRYESVLKDTPSRQLRGRVDEAMPVGIRHVEPYHDTGNPMKEWQARLRENDSSPPYEVNTGTYLPRDPEAGSGLKRSLTCGTLKKAPWRHGAAPFEDTKEVAGYVSAKNFDSTGRRPGMKHDESQVWKKPQRVTIQEHERKKLPYQRPIDYGVAKLLS